MSGSTLRGWAGMAGNASAQRHLDAAIAALRAKGMTHSEALRVIDAEAEEPPTMTSINYDAAQIADGIAQSDRPESAPTTCDECGGYSADGELHEDCDADRDARKQVADRYEAECARADAIYDQRRDDALTDKEP